MRLNGWQRGGIVLSLIWMVIGGLWGLSAVRSPTALQSAFCRAMSQLYERPSDYLEQDDITREPYDCYAVSAGNDRVAIPFIFALAPIPVAWLLVYGLVGSVRSIKRRVTRAKRS